MAIFLSRSPEETRAWAETYAKTLSAGDVGKVCLVEWSENIAPLLPAHCKRIVIRKTGENGREIET